MSSDTTNYRQSGRALPRTQMFASERKYCHSCWRDEVHVPKQCAYLIQLVAVFMTLGLVVLIWPYRCACCGTTRPNKFRTWLPFQGHKAP